MAKFNLKIRSNKDCLVPFILWNDFIVGGRKSEEAFAKAHLNGEVKVNGVVTIENPTIKYGDTVEFRDRLITRLNWKSPMDENDPDDLYTIVSQRRANSGYCQGYPAKSGGQIINFIDQYFGLNISQHVIIGHKALFYPNESLKLADVSFNENDMPVFTWNKKNNHVCYGNPERDWAYIEKLQAQNLLFPMPLNLGEEVEERERAERDEKMRLMLRSGG